MEIQRLDGRAEAAGALEAGVIGLVAKDRAARFGRPGNAARVGHADGTNVAPSQKAAA